MEDEKEFHSFKRSEKINKVIYLGFGLNLLTLETINAAGLINTYGAFYSIYGLTQLICAISLLIYSYKSLRKLLEEHYEYRYQEIQKQMKYFFFLEILGICLGAGYNLYLLFINLFDP
jgi:hypothetical protein